MGRTGRAQEQAQALTGAGPKDGGGEGGKEKKGESMSNLGRSFDTAQRAWDSMSPPEPLDPPDELDDCVKCNCGGRAVFRPANRNLADPCIECSKSPRCGRRVRLGGLSGFAAGLKDAVAEWNREIKIDACDKHSWSLEPSEQPCKPVYRCVFCPAILGEDV